VSELAGWCLDLRRIEKSSALRLVNFFFFFCMKSCLGAWSECEPNKQRFRKRAGLSRISGVKVRNQFQSMAEFGGKNPRCFFVGALVPSPMD
jgi:hypothetical protein